LWVFTYASAHLVSFLTFLLGWDITRLGEEVTERPYVLAGFSAWFILLTMALTSTPRWMRRLGRWWKRLHAMVYGVLGLAAVHYLLMIRSDWAWPVTYAVCAVILLAMRLIQRRQVIVTSN
jgi:sulfoxide reductase heme-binding subunit YedZ